MRKRRAVIVLLVMALVGWTTYAVLFDLDGEFAPTADPDEVVDRVGKRVTGAAKKTKKTAKKVDRKLNPKTQKGKAGKAYKRAMDQVK